MLSPQIHDLAGISSPDRSAFAIGETVERWIYMVGLVRIIVPDVSTERKG
jgi:hypothetical protein